MDSEHAIFVGFSLTDQVDALLEQCAERDRIYLEDPAYLEKIVIDGKTYVGKQIKNGAPLDRIEDTARSVVSLLMRVNQQLKAPTARATVIAIGEGTDNGDLVVADESDDPNGFDYTGLVD
jgi:hypothetical protein